MKRARKWCQSSGYREEWQGDSGIHHPSCRSSCSCQDGRGGKSSRPMPGDGWVADALKTHRVVLVDQRGTGRSTRVQGSTIAALSVPDAVAYLLCFRAN